MFSIIVANQQKYQLQNLIDSNQYTEKFGIRLSEKEALILLENRKKNLREQERIEFGEAILPKLIYTFCDSHYIYQDNYVETITKLQEIFYYYKNESLDELSDDELLSFMKEHFDGDCQGSLEYLETTCLDEFCNEIKKGCRTDIGRNQDE
ncbi:MAG: hypothetical protein K0R15_1492 [Clostridiales bacterium]|jgi:uncharacterized protein YciW|nr:hypothetical protein [Clostridiales bacterium]